MLQPLYRFYCKAFWPLLLPVYVVWGLEPVIASQGQEKRAIFVKYANNQEDDYFKVRDQYFIDLLNLAAKYSDVKISLVPARMTNQVESRVVLSVEKGELDVHWLHTNAHLESELLPIRIPLYKGLIGWRLMLIRQEDRDLLKGIASVDALRQFPVLQSFDWPDTPILKASGFEVESSVDFRSLFRMLRYGRADMFPRSIVEIWGELDDQSGLDLMVDPYVTLHYPTAYYFFVAKGNKKLRDLLAQGLTRAIESGDFEQHFQKHFSAVIKKAKLTERTLISIKNPNLPALTPLDKKHLWFIPEKSTVKP
ncbi:transporter substrate-binding domain-containing protein [Marinagarivorans cellulosilyticus]|uniref:Solute-binding protein family 3/N-terminal domain-containing protein n=1 Tax=Marinagarivorans cellulosilyticus TaxID=2721545 RepID=A0AAN1WEM5_9GAMM|nr:transporter substrate-binding domain-containing protein [Marinagarivorans cellulosilyticus]BCD96203.1 hypothetical protein MARGE09_P0402 [Marinagarivorans cellulosilyticus]